MNNECNYCYTPVLAEQRRWTQNIHRACWDERERRYSIDKCTRCGKNDTRRSACSKCEKTNAKYKGYEDLVK